ncbi:hypothetical protein AU106_gp258 [Sinorhizobium phage phiM9]|uniref:Transmembrane protein n=1 Tax=Sinorhizobium phage phiM9 TaxID=1636182 RepID=A0A0F6TGW8_9CAUD|nr:hypothetical protein AU106_gp258 [Sinorhizobium phage phiM9]AKE44889.1 hypothetical protein Sm_phiM9_262 [Sinorhizobium phage phiM9]
MFKKISFNITLQLLGSIVIMTFALWICQILYLTGVIDYLNRLVGGEEPVAPVTFELFTVLVLGHMMIALVFDLIEWTFNSVKEKF